MGGKAMAASRWLEGNGWWIGAALLLAVVLWIEDGTLLFGLALLAVSVLLAWALIARAVRGFRRGWRDSE